MKAVVRGIDTDGKVVFYTGKLGDAWLSNDPSKAFLYDSLEAANYRAKVFNLMPVEGLHFIGQYVTKENL